MSDDNIEEGIDEIDALYYWAADYCKQHKCDVMQFYADNAEEVEMIIDKYANSRALGEC